MNFDMSYMKMLNKKALAVTAFLFFTSGVNTAWARCDDGQRDIATRMVQEAKASADEIDKLILLKRSLKTCPDFVGWLEMGRVELSLENTQNAVNAFENARDFYQPGADGTISVIEVRRQAIGNGWLAEAYLDSGDLALASVATKEALTGFEAVNQPTPQRLLRLQARIDDSMVNAGSAVISRSLEVQHQRASRGIGVRPKVNRTESTPEEVSQTVALEAEYQGISVAQATMQASEAINQNTAAETAEVVTLSQTTPVTESRLNIPVLFDLNSADLSPASQQTVVQLGAAIGALNLNSAASVIIVGHTDAQGSADYNQTLSGKRAQTVLRNLRSLVTTDALWEAQGRGEQELRYQGNSNDDHRRNRRVEVIVRR